MIAVELSASITEHGLKIVSDALPRQVKKARVIVMYEEDDVGSEGDADTMESANTTAKVLSQDEAKLMADIFALSKF